MPGWPKLRFSFFGDCEQQVASSHEGRYKYGVASACRLLNVGSRPCKFRWKSALQGMVSKLIKRGLRYAQTSLSWSSVRMHGQLVQSNQKSEFKDQQLGVVGETVLPYVLLTLPTPPCWSWHKFRPLPSKNLGFGQLPKHAVRLAFNSCIHRKGPGGECSPTRL